MNAVCCRRMLSTPAAAEACIAPSWVIRANAEACSSMNRKNAPTPARNCSSTDDPPGTASQASSVACSSWLRALATEAALGEHLLGDGEDLGLPLGAGHPGAGRGRRLGGHARILAAPYRR